jgi:hypothetical protein
MEQGQYIDGESGADFTYGYGAGESTVADSGGSLDYFGDADFTYGYGAGESAVSSGDLYGDYLNYWLEQGLDFQTASEWAAEDAGSLSIGQSILESGASQLPSVPMTSFVDPWQFGYTPIFPDLPAPLPPIITPTIPFTVQPPPQVPLPQTPTSGQIPIAPGLPPACPTGQYHPFPIGHPDQNKCVPFPPAQVKTSPAPIPAAAAGGAQKSPTQQQQKPPTQQQQQQPKCPTGYYLDPATRQCRPIPPCTTPGTVFDQARGLCVPQGQAISPLPEGVEGLFDELKNLPWWIWLALGGLILLSRDGEGGKKTTVTYRRAS